MKSYFSLPVMNESGEIHKLMDCLEKQSCMDFELVVCVNQPDDWWEDEEKLNICRDNQKTIGYLQKSHPFPVTVIDKSTRGNGWKGKQFGVGWARKTAMDFINRLADPDDVILSIDADTHYPPGYLASILEGIRGNRKKVAVSVPYYHELCGDEQTDRAILHYELYMRNYSLNMWRINNPYRFTALGSAIALPVWAYRKIGGITPHKSGEDFYMLQKLCKTGELIWWNPVKAYPSARQSDRVFFGTGPAIIKGISGDWSSYPVYHHSLFDKVKATYDKFEALYKEDTETPMDDFLRKQFREGNIWKPLRENASSTESFMKACTHKVDGLRILQFLKSEQNRLDKTSEECLAENSDIMVGEPVQNHLDSENLDFERTGIRELNNIRNKLVEKEDELLSRNSQPPLY